MKKLFVVLLLALLVGCSQQITSFQECVDAGNAVMESFPRQCNAQGKTFVENVTTITVSSQKQLCGDQYCLEVNDGLLTQDIRGFEYESGYEYVLEVKVDQIYNAPPQPVTLDFSLVNVLEKNQVTKACTREYMPVCGTVDIQCVTTPCDPLRTTFSNQCEAENAGAYDLTEGACVEEPNPRGACLSFDGNWLEESQECEGMVQSQCEDLGGTFNECASPCRNDADAEFCVMMCVQVCAFN